jgi:hypothetical protein
MIDLSQIKPKDLELLYFVLHDAISESTKLGKDEPNKVAKMTYKIPKALNDLKLNINGYLLKVGGVFVHQRPYVVFGDAKSVELGDLLLISTVIDSKGGINRRAILLQAKMFDDLPITPDEDQHDLYKNWPPFQYKAKYLHVFNDGKREIKDLDIYSSAKYLLLAKSPKDCFWPFHFLSCRYCCSLTAQPTEELSHHTCFVDELANFVLGDRGKSFDTTSELKSNDIGWNRVINDLLESIANKTTKKMQNSGDNSKGTRGYGVLRFGHELNFLNLFTQELVNWQADDQEPPNEIPPWPESSNDDDGGISVIEFVLQQTDIAA